MAVQTLTSSESRAITGLKEFRSNGFRQDIDLFKRSCWLPWLAGRTEVSRGAAGSRDKVPVGKSWKSRKALISLEILVPAPHWVV